MTAAETKVMHSILFAASRYLFHADMMEQFFFFTIEHCIMHCYGRAFVILYTSSDQISPEHATGVWIAAPPASLWNNIKMIPDT